MPNKFHRQNLRMGSNPFARKSNLQKIAEVFGPKKKDKKVKKPTKRMMANVGGGADTGRIGEMKSKLAVLSDKVKKDLKKINKKFKGSISDEELKKLKEMTPSQPLAKGGPAKKKKKFPDMSGDGKVTMKDVLMARGVIPKKKKTKKKVI